VRRKSFSVWIVSIGFSYTDDYCYFHHYCFTIIHMQGRFENFGISYQIHLDVSSGLRLLSYLLFVICLVAVRVKKAQLTMGKTTYLSRISMLKVYSLDRQRETDRGNQTLFILVVGKKVLVSVAGYLAYQFFFSWWSFRSCIALHCYGRILLINWIWVYWLMISNKWLFNVKIILFLKELSSYLVYPYFLSYIYLFWLTSK
jgi:hypothetical protein